MNQHKRCAVLLRQFSFYILLQVLLRMLLFGISLQVASLQPGDVFRTFAIGFVFDAVTACYYCLPLALLLLFLPARWLEKKKGRYPVYVMQGIMVTAAITFTTAQFVFWRQFYTNFNFIAIDYIHYISETITTFFQYYQVQRVGIFVFFAVCLITVWQIRRVPYGFGPIRRRKKVAAAGLVLVFPLLLAAVVQNSWRSYASMNRYNVEISGNGPYALVHAFWDAQLDYNSFYTMQEQQIVKSKLRTFLKAPNSEYTGKGITRFVDNRNEMTGCRPHIILIIAEGLSSMDLPAFGGNTARTPYLEELAGKSYIFTNMLSSGQRTARGLEAVLLSLPPVPGQSRMNQENLMPMMTLGEVLNGQGYKSDFLYGGSTYFDNIDQFFSHNGYAVKSRLAAVQERTLKETIWGVPDDVLFDQVLQSMNERYQEGVPAFETVLTMNHRTYQFGEGSMEAPEGRRVGGIAYTDWAIQKFMDKAQQYPWFSNTVFVIVSANREETSSRLNLAIDKYRIPCMIYAPGILQPAVNNRLLGQIDIGPTLLGLLGISYESNFMGYDVNRIEPQQERAFISNYQNLGFVKGNHLVVLTPGKQINTYRIDDWKKGLYTSVDNDPALMAEAIFWYQGGACLYRPDCSEGSGEREQ